MSLPAAYVERVNRAIDYIVRNLAQPLSLNAVAETANISPYHFQRVFKSLLGESPSQFVKRQRLERALHMMSHAPKRPLTQVALECGFSSSSDFSRSFRQRYGQAPRAFDLEDFRQSGRAQIDRALSSQIMPGQFTSAPQQGNPDGFEARLRDLPARTVAYLRVFDPYREGVVQAACERMLTWAVERGLADGHWLGYMWDEPEIVALADCRYDVALEVDQVEPDGEIGRFEFPPMRVAEVIVRGDLALEARAIDWLYESWLPRSGYVPDDQPAFEAWVGRPYAHGNAYFEIACQLPVKPA